VWFYEDVSGRSHRSASTTSTGSFSRRSTSAARPRTASLLDLRSPRGSVWTVAGHPTATASRSAPVGHGDEREHVLPVGFAELAFTAQCRHPTQDAGFITKPAGYTYESHGSWSAVHNVAHTWTGGARVVSRRHDQVYDSSPPSITRATSPWLRLGREPDSQADADGRSQSCSPGATTRSLTPVVDWRIFPMNATTSRSPTCPTHGKQQSFDSLRRRDQRDGPALGDYA